MEELALTDEKTLATVLLITPDFAQYSVDAYDALADSLGAALVNLGLEKDLQLVFFHPEYALRPNLYLASQKESHHVPTPCAHSMLLLW